MIFYVDSLGKKIYENYMYKDLKFIKEYNNQLNNINYTQDDKENINDILNGAKLQI